MTTQINPNILAAKILQHAPLLRTKLARTLLCPPGECDAALAEVIKFLMLAAQYSDSQITPSARVDMAWHEFILFTRTYESFCTQHFGRMIHHEPSNDQQKNERQYAETLQSYRQVFGEPPAGYWGGANPETVGRPSAHCGNCEAEN